MALDATGRTRVWAHLMRQLAQFGPLDISKADLKAAVDATDDWIEAAAGAAAPPSGYNSALPQPFRGAASVQQKTILFCSWLCAGRGFSRSLRM